MHLADRYPDIQFLLTITPHKKVCLPKRASAFEKWLGNTPLEPIDILYVIGLIGFPLPERVEQWLREKPERALVFVESRLGAFATFEQHELISNPQIHFCCADSDPIEQLAQDFPSEQIAIYEGLPFDSFALKRRSATFSALYSDVLYSHKIVDNVLHNMHHLAHAFDATGDFNGIPLIICGAGPSVEKAIPILKREQNRALIMAVGSGIAALTRRGIIPHLAMALDPNDAEFSHLAQGEYFEGPFIFSPRLHRDVFSTSNGPFGYLQSDTGGLIESFIDEELPLDQKRKSPDLGSEAFSVTTLAVSWASAQGFSDLFFVGIDLAYTSGKRYASGVVGEDMRAVAAPALDEVVERQDIHDRRCQTLIKWVMESEVISSFAKEHPETRFVNCSMEGLGFEGIPNYPLEEVLETFPQRDFRGIIHSFAQEKKLSFDVDRYQKLIGEIGVSLEKCASLCVSILEEKNRGKLALLTSDLREEKAYCALLSAVDVVLSHLLQRHYPHLDAEVVREKRQEAKYRELKRQIDLFRQIFARLVKNPNPSVL